MRLVLLFLAAAATAFPQHLSFGLKAGHPFEEIFGHRVSPTAILTPASGRYTIGPMIELHLPARASIELDVLYRPAKYSASGVSLATLTDITAGEWRVPLIAKYRLRNGLVTPFLGGGAAWRRFSGVTNADQTGGSTGGVATGGIEGKLAVIRLSGELRYTRWGAATFHNVVTGLAQANPNQVEVLVGISF